jgi:hypothetical protein
VTAPDPAAISLYSILAIAAIALLVPVALGVATERLQILVAAISRKATVRIRSQVFGHINRLDSPNTIGSTPATCSCG